MDFRINLKALYEADIRDLTYNGGEIIYNEDEDTYKLYRNAACILNTEKIVDCKQLDDSFLAGTAENSGRQICLSKEEFEIAVFGQKKEEMTMENKNNTIEVQVEGGKIKAWVMDDPDYPGISVEFFPDNADDKASYPRVTMEKPVEENVIRALRQEDYTEETIFEEPVPSEEEDFSDPVDPVAALMSKIEEKAKRDRRKKEEKEIKVATQVEVAIQNIREMENRIQTIMQLANKCIEEDILIPESYFSDGIDHKVGFMGHNGSKKIQYVGIYNGGYYGPYDFYTNGDEVFKCTREDDATYTLDDPKDAEKFLAEFGAFETDFYVWLECKVAED